MYTRFYAPLHNEKLRSNFSVTVEYPNSRHKLLSMKNDDDFELFKSLILDLFNDVAHRFSITVIDVDNIEILIEADDGRQLIFNTNCKSLFTTFANGIYAQFASEK